MTKPLNLNLEITNWRKQDLGTLKAFFTIKFKDQGIEVRDFTLHRTGEKSWVGYPSRPWTDREGNVVKDNEGRVKYSPIFKFFEDDAHFRFQADVLQLIDYQLWETKTK